MSTITAMHIDTDGTLTMRELNRTADGSLLEALYAALDASTIEIVQLPGRIDVVIDEEGKLCQAEPNRRATITALTLGGRFLPGDYIAGPALFIGYADSGEHVGLTVHQAKRIVAASID